MKSRKRTSLLEIKMDLLNENTVTYPDFFVVRNLIFEEVQAIARSFRLVSKGVRVLSARFDFVGAKVIVRGFSTFHDS